MNRIIKYFTLTIVAILLAIYILQDFLFKPEIWYYIIVALIIFSIDTVTKWSYNKYLVSIFIPDKIPIPSYLRKISNGFISIAAIIIGYQIGIGFGIDFNEEFIPSIDRLENDKIFIAILFFVLISILIYTIYGIWYYIKKEFEKISYEKLKEIIMKIQISTKFLIVLIVVIIILIPWLFTRESFLPDFSDTGQIGDTIGGLTAPFINGLAAILVFIAFREQVRANKDLKSQILLQKEANIIHKEQDERNRLLNLISGIKGDFEAINKTVDDLIIDLKNKIPIGQQISNKIEVDKHLLNRVIFAMSEMRLLHKEIDCDLVNKDFVWKKAYYLYTFLFRDKFTELYDLLQHFVAKKQMPTIHELEPLFEIPKLTKTYDNPNKYSSP